ncbi:MAG: alpha/beta hydrolase [Pseudomonadota bacterium]
MPKSDIFFATNRALRDADEDVFVEMTTRLSVRSKVHLGVATVRREDDPTQKIDEAFVVESVRRIEPKQTGGVDPDPVGGAALKPFFNSVFESISHPKAQILLHVHGFAVRFDVALHRAAELQHQYRPSVSSRYQAPQPAVISFIWPSSGKLFRKSVLEGLSGLLYCEDRTRARASGAVFGAFLAAFARAYKSYYRGAGPEVALVAHSMGNWVLENALAKFSAANAKPFLKHAFLMAADCDRSALKSGGGLAPLRDMAEQISVYYSVSDLPIKTAPKWCDEWPDQRLGESGPPRSAAHRFPNVEIVNCDHVCVTGGWDHVCHQFYRLRGEVLQDVRWTLEGRPAAYRRTGWAADEGHRHWRLELNDDYYR